MKNVWVYRYNGEIQCDDSSSAISLEKMAEELAMLIGGNNIISSEERNVIMIRLCGMPKGVINVYQITPSGWNLLNNGFVGNPGFMPLPESENEVGRSAFGEEGDTIRQALARSVRSMPTTIKDLIGRPLRAYEQGSPLTKDWRPERVNIELSIEGKILDVWFG